MRTSKSDTRRGFVVRLGVLLAVLAFAAAACGGAGPEPSDVAEEGSPAAAEGGTEGATEQESEEFSFAGKTLRIRIGFGAGGGFDFYGRTVSRYMERYLPGSPDVVIENVDGGGTAVAAKRVAEAEPDGTNIGVLLGTLFLRDVLGDPSIDFDTREFGFLGIPHADIGVCIVRADAPATTIEEMKETEITLAGEAPGGLEVDFGNFLNNVVGTNLRIVEGYPGSSELLQAVRTGEAHATCTSWGSIEDTLGAELESGEILVWGYVTAEPREDEYAALAEEFWAGGFMPDEQAKRLYDAYVASRELHRTFVVTPGSPEPAVQALRDALESAVNDPEFLAEMEQAERPVRLVTGEEVEQIVRSLFDLDEEVAGRLRNALGVEY